MSGVDYSETDTQRGPWDIVVLAGFPFTGVAAVTGDSTRKIEVKRLRGSDGAVITDAGYEPARLTISLMLGTLQAFEDLKQLLARVHPRKKGGIRNPVTIEHPAPNMIGIHQIYVTGVGIPTVSSKGLTAMSLQAIEWFPAPVKAKPKTAVIAGANRSFIPEDGICAVDPSPAQRQSGTAEAVGALMSSAGEPIGGITVDLDNTTEREISELF